MKAKFLPFLLLTVLLQVSMFSYADEMVTARQIKLRTKTQVQHRSIPTDLNVDKVYIDLAGEEKGKYTLEIQLPKEAFIGDFELD